MIDTLKISNSLQSHQFSREQAEAMAEAIGEIAVGELVTRKDLDLAKSDLQLAIERLRGEPQRFILVSIVLVAIAQILVLKIWR
jgi:hypothetical protein